MINSRILKMTETQTSNNINTSPKLETQIPPLGGGGAENSIYISDKAKIKVLDLMKESGVADDDAYFLRVGVVGGCLLYTSPSPRDS